jgi:hypothetical protein
MEDDLNFLDKQKTPQFLRQMEDELNLKASEKLPQFVGNGR